MFSSMNVTMEVWRVIGWKTICCLRFPKHFFCIQVMKSQPFFVLKIYIVMTIIHIQKEAGMMRYSGLVTT